MNHAESIFKEFKDAVAIISNALLTQKTAKYKKQVFDEMLLGIFLHRLKILNVANVLELTPTEMNYLESKDIVDQVIESPA